MREIVFSNLAREELLSIWRHIARENFEAAERFQADVEDLLTTLARFPGLGHSRPDAADEEHRVWSVGKYLIFYRWNSDRLTVVRVVHGARDLRNFLRRSS
jgi:plasmid stabilization system protein ParE